MLTLRPAVADPCRYWLSGWMLNPLPELAETFTSCSNRPFVFLASLSVPRDRFVSDVSSLRDHPLSAKHAFGMRSDRAIAPAHRALGAAES
jgi:hypothetical protein